MDYEKIMKQWDYWRKEIANGNKSSAPRDWFESVLEATSIGVDVMVIKKFASLRDLINNINDSIDETDGLSVIPRVVLETDGYEFYIKFLDSYIWDSDNEGWNGRNIVELEKDIREEIRKYLESYSKISL